MGAVELLRTKTLALLDLAKFAIALALIVGIPPLSRRVRLPALVGLLLSGVLIGPHGLGLFGEKRPIGDFFADLGALLLMFFSGMEIDLALFRRARSRSLIFGLITCITPLLLGTGVALWFGYQLVPSIAMGSLLVSHTLLASPIVTQLGLNRFEPVTITVGATVLSDTTSLVVFAICASTYKSGFSMSVLATHLIELAAFVPLVLIGLSRAGAYLLARLEDDENAYFILMLGIMAVAGVVAQAIDLPGIVGAFMAGLSINAAAHDKPAKDKLKFFGYSFFIPSFFIVTGFLIDPRVFARSTVENFGLVAGILGAVVIGKWAAAAIASRAYGYSPAARWTMFSLTLPQVAATITATLVGFATFNAGGQRLIDGQMLNAIFVLMLTTSIFGPLLTDHFAPLMLTGRDPVEVPAAQSPTR